MPRSSASHTPYRGRTHSDAPVIPGASLSCRCCENGLAGHRRLKDADDSDPLGVTGLLVLDLDPDDARLARLDGHGDLAVLARRHRLRDAGAGDLDLRSRDTLLTLGDL